MANTRQRNPPSSTGSFAQLLFAVAGRHRLGVIEAFICSALLVEFTIALQKAEQVLVDTAFPGAGHPGDSGVLVTVMVALAVGLVVASFAALRAIYLVAYLSGRMVRDLRVGLFEKLQYLRYSRL